MATKEIIFRGDFDPAMALKKFDAFVGQLRQRIGNLKVDLNFGVGGTGGGSSSKNDIKARVASLYNVAVDAMGDVGKRLNAAKKRINDALGKGLIDETKAATAVNTLENKYRQFQKVIERIIQKREEGIKLTNADILAMRRLISEMGQFNKVADYQEKLLAMTHERVKQNAKGFNEFFRATVIGGFALQQLGGFLNANVTQPLIGISRRILDVTVLVDNFEQTLAVRGGKTKQQIDEIYQAVKRVSDLPNMEREDVVRLFTRLTEATRGGVTAKELEQIGRGISVISTGLESAEKRPFFGQLQDILAGGDVANLQKTLSLVPMLKTEFDKLKASATVGTSDSELILQALKNLGNLPVIDNLETKIKRLRNAFFDFQERVGKAFRPEMEALLKWVETRVIPLIDKLIKAIEQASPATRKWILALLAATAALAPLAYTLGTLGVVTGGIAYLFKALSLGVAILTGNVVAAEVATGSLTSLLASVGGGGGLLASIGAGLSQIVTYLNPVTAAIAALVALLSYAFVKNIGYFYDLTINALSVIWDTLKSVVSEVLRTVDAIGRFIKAFVELPGVSHLIAIIAGAVGLLFNAFAYLFEIVTKILNPFTMLANLFEFLADILEGKFTVAMYRLNKNMLLMIQNTTPLRKLFELFGGNVQKEIDKLDVKLRELGEQTEKTAEETKKAVEEEKKAEQKKKELQASVEKLTEALKAQEEQLVQNINRWREERLARMNAVIGDYAQGQISTATENIGDIDITQPGGEDRAREELKANQVRRIEEAERVAKEEHQATVRTAIDKAVDDLVNIEKLYTGAVAQKLQPIFFKVIQDLSKQLNAQNPEEIKKILGELNTGVVQVLKDSYGEQQTDAVKKVGEYVDNTYDILSRTITEAGNAGIDKVGKAQQQNTDDEIALEKRIREARQKAIDNAAVFDIEKQTRRYERELELNNRRIEYYRELLDNTVDTEKALSEIAKIEERNLELEILIIRTQAKADAQMAKEQAEKDLIFKKAEQSVKELTANRPVDDNADRILRLREINKKLRETQEAAKEVLQQVRMTNADLQELYIELAGLGAGNKEKFLDLQNRYVSKSNILSDMQVQEIERVMARVKLIAKSDKVPGSDAKALKDTLDMMGSLNGATLADNKQLTTFIDQVTAILAVLNAVDRTTLNEADSTQMEATIRGLTGALETLNKQRTTNTNDAVDQMKRETDYNDALIHARIRANEVAQDTLDIEKQIIEQRAKRGVIPEVKNLGSFGKAVYDILVGTSEKLYEIQKQQLQRQKEAIDLELQSTLLRLQLEQQILLLRLKAAGVSDEELKAIQIKFDEENKKLREQAELQKTLINEQIAGLSRVSGTVGEILMTGITKAITGIFDKAKKKKTDDVEHQATGQISGNVIDGPLITDDATDETKQNVQENLDWLGQLQGGLAMTRDVIFGLGDAIMQMNDFSLKSILRTIKEELYALAKKALIKSLEYAALALSAAVFGDWSTAARAGAAAAAWGAVAVAAGAAGALIGTVDGTDQTTAQAQSDRSAGATDDFDETKDKEIQRQKGFSVYIGFDVRQDEGILMKKQIRWVNGNTELTTVIGNSQSGFVFSPAP